MTAIDRSTTLATPEQKVLRVEIRPKENQPDPTAHAIERIAKEAFGQNITIHSARVFLINAPLTNDGFKRIANELLTDPITQTAFIGASARLDNSFIIEVQHLPGVMDPVAQSTQAAIIEMLTATTTLAANDIQVRTGYRYDFNNAQADEQAILNFAKSHLANPVIQNIFLTPHHPEKFVAGTPYQFKLTHVAIRELDEQGLTQLSREGHLFLSLEEMQSIQAYYRQADREPTDIELETLAQTWSEHCVHKTLKSIVNYTQDASLDLHPTPSDWANRVGHTLLEDGSLQIDNLLKSTIAAATTQLMQDPEIGEWCVSVFVDNSGIVQFDEHDAICIKVETHNHPSAIEPYGGAATGIGGCIRDIMGTGLVGKPIANTNVFCVAPPIQEKAIPTGVLHPKRVLERVVAGVRDYGNRMGIPTVHGSVWFDQNYLGNPLVFAGCIGIIPTHLAFGDAMPGDRIIALGGRTGRDGIHGATFSSAELTDTHADEFSHAVQIGNAITEKQTLDVILQARDDQETGKPLFSAVTDCGAGGFSSAIGEMGEKVGARVELDQAPLKYDGLSYTEIWISEAQERMVLAVPSENTDKLKAICQAENVEYCDLGEFGLQNQKAEPELLLTYQGQEVGRLSMLLLHDGIPTPTRQARSTRPPSTTTTTDHADQPLGLLLHQVLGHPNVASKHWIIRQYDHEVQGGSAIKPLVGPNQSGPSDAAVLRPKLNSDKAIAISSGLQTGISELAAPAAGDSYWMTLSAIDEVIRNLICVGGNPKRIALLDNFCWPSCDKPENFGSLVRAAEACYDGAMAYRTPFVSGKDSLNNQFTTEDGSIIAIPPTLLITGVAMVSDVKKCITMDAKKSGNRLVIVGQTTSAIGGSHYQMVSADSSRDNNIPKLDLKAGPLHAKTIAELIASGLIASAHDCSDGGLLVAAAEMAFAGDVGLELNLQAMPTSRTLDEISACFAETPSRYLLEVTQENLDEVFQLLAQQGIDFGEIGLFTDELVLKVASKDRGLVMTEKIDQLQASWQKTLDW